jgi:hypothetical protein
MNEHSNARGRPSLGGLAARQVSTRLTRFAGAGTEKPGLRLREPADADKPGPQYGRDGQLVSIRGPAWSSVERGVLDTRQRSTMAGNTPLPILEDEECRACVASDRASEK